MTSCLHQQIFSALIKRNTTIESLLSLVENSPPEVIDEEKAETFYNKPFNSGPFSMHGTSNKSLSVDEKSALLKIYYVELDSKYYGAKKEQVIFFLFCLKTISGLPYYNLPTEVWSLILAYVAVIDLLNLSLCSKFFCACAHNNVRLDEKMRVSK